jgi:predicted amidohydrolase
LAKEADADVIHFPETALSGYGTKFDRHEWSLLENSLDEIKNVAKKLHLYVVLGSLYKVASYQKPFNCTYLISDQGLIEGKYFKNHLYKQEKDLFSCKSNFLIKNIKGIKCGFLICYDSCFPDSFQQYRDKGIGLLFLSYYNAKSSKNKNSMDELMRAQLITRASDNLMYISASNSCERYSRMPSSFACPDGSLISLKRHKTGILICDYPKEKLGWTYDNSED